MHLCQEFLRRSIFIPSEFARRFVEQYNQFAVLPGKRINGSFALNENFADNLGLELAYRAYKSAVQQGEVEQPKRLLGLEKFSPEQLFFLSYDKVGDDTFINPHSHERFCLTDIIFYIWIS